MSKIELPEVGPGNSGRLRTNDNFRKVEETLSDKVLFRDNPTGEPNEMNNDLDMNSKRVYNLPVPTLDHEATPWGEVKGGVPEAKKWAEEAKESALESAESADQSAASALVATEQAERSETEADRAQAAADSVSGAIGRIGDLEEFNETLQGDTGASLVGYMGRSVQDRLNDRYHISSWASLSTPTNWQPAIQAALTFANGKDLYFESGQTYPITSPIVYTGDASIKTTGAEKAIIFQNGQVFDPLRIQGPAASATTSLTANTKAGNKGWTVASTTGIVPGMLMEVLSSLSWYHDPRPESSDTRKSELHRVASIVGNVVFTEDPANDGYDMSAETVQVTFYSPIKVRIDNLEVRSVKPPAAPTTPDRVGIRIQRADSALLTNINSIDTIGAGVIFMECYRPTIKGALLSGINKTTTGYGIQTWGCAHTLISDCKFYECRKGVDFSGQQTITRNSIVEHCVVTGGGVASTGEIFGYSETGILGTDQVGMGSHGQCDIAIYRYNTFNNVLRGINILGRNAFVEDNKFFGRFSQGVNWTGDNVYIRRNVHKDDWSTEKNGTVLPGTGFADVNHYRMNRFVRVGETGATGDLVIEGNAVQISWSMLSYTTDVVNFGRIIIRNNNVEVSAPPGTEASVGMIVAEGAARVLSDCTISGNNAYRIDGAGFFPLLKNATISSMGTVENGGVAAGLWSPTLTGISNVASVTPLGTTFMYSKVGMFVTISGAITVTATAADTNTTFRFSLPIATNFAGSVQACGTANSSDGQTGFLSADSTTKQIWITLRSIDTSARVMRFSGVYQVL